MSLQGPPIVGPRPINGHRAKQASRGEVESVVHEKVHYTKELNEFANSFKATVWYITRGTVKVSAAIKDWKDSGVLVKGISP